MVKLSCSVEDSTYELIQDRATRSNVEPERMAQYLLQEGAKTIPVRGTRAVILAGPVLEQVEAILGGLPVLHGADLVQKISHLAGISFEHLRLPFSPQQLGEIAQRADRQGKSVEQVLAEAAPRVFAQFFDLLSR